MIVGQVVAGHDRLWAVVTGCGRSPDPPTSRDRRSPTISGVFGRMCGGRLELTFTHISPSGLPRRESDCAATKRENSPLALRRARPYGTEMPVTVVLNLCLSSSSV